MARLLWLALLVAWLAPRMSVAAAEHPNGAPAVSAMDALQMEANALEQTITNQARLLKEAQQQQASSPLERQTNWVLIIGVAVVGVLAIRMLAPRVGELLNRRDPWAGRGAEHDAAAEEQAFNQFAETFVAGPKASAAAAQPVSTPAAAAAPRPVDPVEEFRRTASKELTALRAVFSGIGSTPEVPARQKILGEFSRQILTLKRESNHPTLMPFWQMTCAVEGLVGQLAKKPAEITPSALRTIASALDLLNSLYLPGVNPRLASEPPVRVLAVDDDAICRHALSMSLQKVLSAPDLASDATAALALAEKLTYDVIFLDVEMPGMNGFELCTKLRETATNGGTPVVFVTRHSDFESRTQSCLSGGRDLIGKPFLPFELAVKALTMVMQRRLQAHAVQRLGLPAPVTGPAVASPAGSVLVPA